MSWLKSCKNFLIGKAKDPSDRRVFHNLSLIAFFAWVGLGADGLSSSCYGPEETYLALKGHTYLSLIVAALSAMTVLIISTSYSQIIQLFPNGGGGYLVASKLLNPTVGMISGCALLIDYVLTIAISVASGADAVFSFLPIEWQQYKILCALAGVTLLMLLNLRGVKESVIPLTPIFMVFVLTHFGAIVYALVTHIGDFPNLATDTVRDISAAQNELGWMGVLFIILKAYSLGAGTYTGIEAVSNGLPLLREPKVETGRRTMQYMAYSLAFTVAGLMIAYLLYGVQKVPGKTLNASLFQNMTANWEQPWGSILVLITLASEAALLFVAAQAGFLDGPRVLSNMALDRWMPQRFATLSDRLVTQNGVLLMGLTALVTVFATQGSVHLLVVLYSINVFITFCLSQAGMVRHWWEVRQEDAKWIKKLSINGLGLALTSFILLTVIILKFHDGGWVTLLMTGGLATLAINIKRHYRNTLKMLKRLNALVETAEVQLPESEGGSTQFDPNAKTAAVLVNGFNGLGLHTLYGILHHFGKDYKNFIFLQAGVIDAGNFKGVQEIERLKETVHKDLQRYITLMNKNGYYAESVSHFGIDVVEEIENLALSVQQKFPGVVFFGGQLVFPKDTWMTRYLHNYTVFALQQRFYQHGIPIVILPIRVAV